jgi:hypothetical protein
LTISERSPRPSISNDVTEPPRSPCPPYAGREAEVRVAVRREHAQPAQDVVALDVERPAGVAGLDDAGQRRPRPLANPAPAPVEHLPDGVGHAGVGLPKIGHAPTVERPPGDRLPAGRGCGDGSGSMSACPLTP